MFVFVGDFYVYYGFTWNCVITLNGITNMFILWVWVWIQTVSMGGVVCLNLEDLRQMWLICFYGFYNQWSSPFIATIWLRTAPHGNSLVWVVASYVTIADMLLYHGGIATANNMSPKYICSASYVFLYVASYLSSVFTYSFILYATIAFLIFYMHYDALYAMLILMVFCADFVPHACLPIIYPAMG